MRVVMLVGLLLLLGGCATSSSYMVASEPDEQGKFRETVYSPYYELEHRTDDGVVIARLVITLGKERMPENHKHTGPAHSPTT